jgi:hypothetical protein
MLIDAAYYFIWRAVRNHGEITDAIYTNYLFFEINMTGYQPNIAYWLAF